MDEGQNVGFIYHHDSSLNESTDSLLIADAKANLQIQIDAVTRKLEIDSVEIDSVEIEKDSASFIVVYFKKDNLVLWP